MYKEKIITVDGTNISYFDEGSAESRTVVFLHGFAGSKNSYAGLIDSLDPYFRILVLDLPGHGNSDSIPNRTIEEYAKYFHKFIQEVGLKEFDLIGFSMGGMLTLSFELMFPGYVRKMVIWESSSDFKGMTRYRAVRLLLKYLKSKPEISQKIYGLKDSRTLMQLLSQILPMKDLGKYKHMDMEILVDLAIDLLDKDISGDVAKMEKDVLVIHGKSKDLVIPEGQVKKLGRILPNATVKSVDGSQHFSTDMEETFETILAFLLEENE